jgi:hypothetical protein
MLPSALDILILYIRFELFGSFALFPVAVRV